MHRDIVLIAHNLRSTHNVGSLLRTADGLAVRLVYLTGYTPYPLQTDDERLPHLAIKIISQIHKTALGAELTLNTKYNPNIDIVINGLKAKGYQIVALEQTPKSINLPKFQAEDKVAVIVGREVDGIEPGVLGLADKIVSIPMLGNKESFNVAQAAAMALYHFRFWTH